MTDPFEELKEETNTPELKQPESREQVTSTTSNETSATASVKESSISKIEKKKDQSPKNGYRWLVSAGIVLALGIFVCIVLAKFIFGIQTASDIAGYYIQTPKESQLEQLSGYGWNVFIAGKRNLRFYTHEQVTTRRQERMKRYTAKDPGFQMKFDTMKELYPDDKKDLDRDHDAIEIWDNDNQETLLHDRVTGLYLLNIEVG